MRIVFISAMAGAPWGGSEELWSQAAIRLKEQGHSVAASVAWWPVLSSRAAGLPKQGVELFVREPAHRSLPARLRRTILSRLGIIENKELKWLERQKPDLVVISQGSSFDGLDWMTSCQNAGLPFASIVQCNTEGWWPADEFGHTLASAYRAAKGVFCVSRHNLKLLEYQIGEPLPKAEVVWNPFNVPAGQPPAWPVPQGVWKAACVARLEPAAKGQDILFAALSLPRWRERPFSLNLYGGGSGLKSLQRMAERLGLGNVRFHGHVQDVRKIWEENQLLILPSRCEGLPMALVEAMWCGRPAVVTDVGGNAELCLDGKTGFVAAAPAATLLDQTLERAWEQRDQWPVMGHAARARVEEFIPNDPVEAFSRRLLQCASPC